MYVYYVRVCMTYVCVREVCAVTKLVYSSSTAAVQRQPFFKLLPCATVYVRVWLVHSSMSNHGNMFTPNAVTKHTSLCLYQLYEAYSSSKCSSSHTSLECLFLLSTCDAPEISNQPHPQGEVCISMQNIHCIFCAVFSGGRRFSLVRSAAGQPRGPSIHHDACLDPSKAPWRCSEHSTSPGSFCQEVALRLAETSRWVHGTPPQFSI